MIFYSNPDGPAFSKNNSHNAAYAKSKLYAFSIILLLRSKMLADTKMVGSTVKLVEIQGDE
jgi:hypothetical protein